MKRTVGYLQPGSLVGGERYSTFIPLPLPPKPPLQLELSHIDRLEKANRALGRLDGLALLIPDTSLFIYFYVRKEAVLSSQIEGTQSSLNDLLLFEEGLGAPLDDVQEVSNYVAAMEYGLARLTKDKFPLSLRLIKEMHKVLLKRGRGNTKTPGEFRRSQNWIGGTRPGNAFFVPPPPNMVLECMGALEQFLHDIPTATPTLIKAALAHVQFETIHPFLDGNGRLGRLLITLLLCAEGALSAPVLYLSLYFKTHREAYYHWLQRVRQEGDWEGWLLFFLEGVIEIAEQATLAAKEIITLFERDEKRIATTLGKATNSSLRIHHTLKRRPIISATHAAKLSGLSLPSTHVALKHLETLRIVKEATGRQRGKVYIYGEYLAIMAKGTESGNP